MSKQKYVFVALLQPLIGLQKQVHSFSMQILPTSSQMSPARCRRTLCRSNLCACDLRAPRQLLLGFEARPGAITFPPEVSSQRSSNGPIRFPHHLFSDRDHGRQRSERGSQRLSCPYDGLTVHPCRGVRRAGDPVDSDPGAVFEDDPHPRSLVAPPEPSVCHHTREPTVLSRLSCRPFHLNFDLSPTFLVFWTHFQDR